MEKKVKMSFTDDQGVKHEQEVTVNEPSFFDRFKKKESTDDKKTDENKGINWKKVGITAGAIGAGVVAALFGYSKFKKSNESVENYLPPVDDAPALPPVDDAVSAASVSDENTATV